MLQVCDEFERAMLEVVLNDFEPFESITAKLSQQHTASGGRFDMRSLQSLLLRLLADDFVGAYLIHAETPYITAVEANSDTTIRRYWYHITGRGQRRLHNLRENHSTFISERSA
jgi:mannose-6-phosphate isomerase class I